MPKVSVVLTSYNHAPYLRQAIDSVLNQTYGDWELLIWDDVSTDGSWEIIQGYSDPRIRAFRNDRNRRYIYAINQSIVAHARGEYIAVHHSDDSWEPDKLNEQVDFLDRNPEVGAVFTRVQVIDESNRPLANDWFDVPNQSRAQWLRLLFSDKNKLCHPSVLARRASYLRAGLYKQVHAQTDDAEMWTRLLLREEIHVLSGRLTLHRVFSDGSNVSGVNPQSHARIQFEWFEQKRNYIGLPLAQVLEIFPEAMQWLPSTREGDPDYLLAMASIHLADAPGTRLFGLDLLYGLLNDPVRAHSIETIHGFDYLKLMQLVGSVELFPPKPVAAAPLGATVRRSRSLRRFVGRLVRHILG